MEGYVETVAKFASLVDKYVFLKKNLWNKFSKSVTELSTDAIQRSSSFPLSKFIDTETTIYFDPTSKTQAALYCKVDLFLEKDDWVGCLTYGYRTVIIEDTKFEFTPMEQVLIRDLTNFFVDDIKVDGRQLQLVNPADVAVFHYQILLKVFREVNKLPTLPIS